MWSVDALLHLRTFVAVAEARSFSRAAEELMIGQPLLSRRVKALEVEIGGELFDRSHRQIEVTELGRTLLDPARDLLGRADRLESFIRSAQGLDTVLLALPHDCDPRAIARLITAATNAGSRLQVEFLTALERETAVRDGAAAVTVVRVPIDLVGYTVELGLGSTSASTDRDRPVHLADLRRHRRDRSPARRILLSAEDDIPLFREPFLKSAAQAGLVVSQIEVENSTTSAIAAVFASADLLVCTRAFARRNGLAWSPLADRSIRRTYQVQVAPAHRSNARLAELASELAPLIGSALDAGSSRRKTDDGEPNRHTLTEAWR
ncbi:LysR family transcriptional regulator [Herbiconiux sp. CPCC 205763]|uniref:LysR family transcriptional regulator n=1 Tax=Herbiconiux aconitum TaxID=2970913 RepID=A0ABT2GNN4_9MICO|nr:LysR family transcriptional regulator [Herbiconiux aconitum]MCS5717788.1 LysR family transcriptional regulator [Herbiconiux aconitum]